MELYELCNTEWYRNESCHNCEQRSTETKAERKTIFNKGGKRSV